MAKKKPENTTSDPAGPLDPSFKQEERRIERGIGDLQQDTKRDLKRGKKNVRTSRRRVRQDRRRAMRDIGTQLERGLQQLGDQATDLRTGFQRTTQDFNQAILGLQRDYGRLSTHQVQQMNAAGLLGGGAEAAAAAQRAFNMKQDREPLDTQMARATQDFVTGKERLGRQQQNLRMDVRNARTDLRQDANRQLGDLRRDWRMTRQDLQQRLSRGVREGRIGQVDVNEQATFDAQERRRMMGY